MSTLSLPQRIIRIHEALAAVPHAFGGAIALGYHAEPRATIDIDLNVFIAVEAAGEVMDPLARIGIVTEGALAAAERDGQVRVMWDATPVDLFFSYDDFHHAAERAVIIVPFADTMIPILSATHLAVCKAVFDRPKDWIDIEAMRSLGTYIDTAEALRWVGRIAGDNDPRFNRLATLLSS